MKTNSLQSDRFEVNHWFKSYSKTPKPLFKPLTDHLKLESDFSKSDAKNCFFKKPSASLCLTVLEHKEYTKLTGRVIIAGSSCGLECVMSSSTLSLPLIHFLTKVPNDASFTDAPSSKSSFPDLSKRISQPLIDYLQLQRFPETHIV